MVRDGKKILDQEDLLPRVASAIGFNTANQENPNENSFNPKVVMHFAMREAKKISKLDLANCHEVVLSAFFTSRNCEFIKNLFRISW